MAVTKAPKTRTVELKCQWVDSDGIPVNQHDEEYGRGWQKCWSWEKRRRSEKWLANPANREFWREIVTTKKHAATESQMKVLRQMVRDEASLNGSAAKVRVLRSYKLPQLRALHRLGYVA